MHTADLALYRSLNRLHTAYSGLLATRATALEELTPAEVQLEAQWQQDIEPVLRDLYWHPLRNGLDSAPEDEQELKGWLRDKLEEPVAIAVLLALLMRYLRRGVNVGGRVGLELLGVGGAFAIANSDYLDRIDDHAERLTRPRTNVSLIDTTVDDLARGIPAARQSADSTLQTLGRLIAGWAAVRSVRIATTELGRSFAWGLNWTYRENGVQTQQFQTRGDDRVCPRCGPLHGRVMPVNRIPSELLVPIHVGCRCGYAAVLDDWDRPARIWRGD